ncbi:hypothetical protein QWY28_07250 [Nocardioides sp. SOB77]|uniref:WD40 repeat domain-containing protein n=1 Tax=Nocardioides oceani TaxID=3058369 RepID=A0ABT8FE51_9ACTN|nr:hypothetical protein [Nocardioides oceani]MDN4172730.1 hypothetical protein [Nocardioides oceani]
MTDRLSALLRAEADELRVPPADAAAVLAGGRRLRRRGRAASGAAALAILALVGGTALVATGGDDPADRVVDLPVAAQPGITWAVGSGSTVHLDDGSSVEVEGVVTSLYYTSAGVLVRTGATSSAGQDDHHYELVDGDGEPTTFDLDLGDRVASTDPSLPLIAYTRSGGDARSWEVVLRDVRSGEEVRSVPVEGAFTWAGWVSPPVALDGDTVYVGLDEATLAVDWRSGEVSTSTLPGSTMPAVRGGREVIDVFDGPRGTEAEAVVDVVGSADPLVTTAPDQLASLSPDGSTALLHGYRMCQDDDRCRFTEDGVLVDLETGRRSEVALDGASGSGWTTDGHLVVVSEEAVEVCDDAGTCEPTAVTVDDAGLRVAGSLYEA